ncbi:MAG: hypothetical protein SCK28_03065 [Bacillota bacterium]|nr:hypothetical protein [Bacillota bacterium]
METNFSNFLEELTEKAAARASLFHNSFPECEKLITSQFQLLAELLTNFRNTAESDLDKSVLIQGYRCFNCSWTAYQNIKSGFLSEGASVAITGLDSALYMEYFISKPHLATRWLDGNDYPVQSFYKILSNAKANQEIFLLLKECTDYGLNHTPRQLIEDNTTPSFKLGGNDDIKKQFLLVKLIAQVLNKALNLLMNICNNQTVAQCQDFKGRLETQKNLLANIQAQKATN